MYFSNRILLSLAFLAVLPIFVGVCLVNCQRISQKFRFLFVIMVIFGMVILSVDVLGQFNMEWKQYQQGFGLMVPSYCSFMLIFFFVVITQINSSDSSSKYCSLLSYWLCCMLVLFAIILLTGLMVVAPIACSVAILLVFILVFPCCLIKKKCQTEQIKKWDFSNEETQMSQNAQYKGDRPSKVNYPVAISNRLFKVRKFK